MNLPKTSQTLLRDLAASAENVRWAEFVVRYRPMMEAYMRERFPSVEADEAIAETLVALVDAFKTYRYDPEETGRFHNYLTGILRHKALQLCRQAKREMDLRERAAGDPALPRTKGDPFTAQFRYEGTDAKGRRVYGIGPQELSKNVYVDERVTLRGPALYKITGPGRLTANIDGTGDVEIEIQRGSLHDSL